MKNPKVFSFILSALLIFGCLSGCQKQKVKNAPTDVTISPAQSDAPCTVTDCLDRKITLPKVPERVVVTFNLEEYLAVTGKEGIDKLVGFSHAYWEGRRQDAWDTYTAAFPQLKGKDDVGYNDSISVEKIISLKPDLVIMSAPVNFDFMEPNLKKLESAGIPILFVNYHAQTEEMHTRSTMALGKAMGQEEKAKEICDFYKEQMNVISQRLAQLPADAKLPKVYMEFSRGVNEYGNSWSKKMWGALIPTCGGINVAADFGDGNSVDVNPELVIAANPDVIIFAASPQKDMDNNVVLGYSADREKAKEALEAYKGRSGWADLSAVQNNRMAAVYHDLSRHIFDFAGAQMLAKTIHPELFADLDPNANLQAFFTRFMPLELNGTWMLTLSE